MGFDLGHTISSVSKLVLRTKRKLDNNNKEQNENIPVEDITCAKSPEKKFDDSKNNKKDLEEQKLSDVDWINTIKDKRKKELLKIYFDIANIEYETYRYFYKSIKDYQLDTENTFVKYINKYENEERIRVCLRMLRDTKKIVYLGMMESLKNDDYSYLDRALNTYYKLSLLCVRESSADHCISSWNIAPITFVLKRFNDIKKVFPKECGLSTRKVWGGITTNLIMYLYYHEESWKEKVLSDANKFLNTQKPLEYQSIVRALLALINKDFEQFSLELSNICKGRKRTKEYGENKFTKEFSFYSLGLYYFAEYLYPDEVDTITLPDDNNFLTNYLKYRQNNQYIADSYIIEFTEPLKLLEKMFSVDTPAISLTKNGRNYDIDYKAFNDELVKRIMEK